LQAKAPAPPFLSSDRAACISSGRWSKAGWASDTNVKPIRFDLAKLAKLQSAQKKIAPVRQCAPGAPSVSRDSDKG